MKERKDFQPDVEPARSIADIIKEELSYTEYDGKTSFPPDGIGGLMERVYAKIEAQALEVYKSNEPWALKAWAYTTILKDAVASEATEPMVEELMYPVMEWQNQGFDPIGHFSKRLKRKNPRTMSAYMQTASRFVAREGRKEEVLH